MWTKSSLCFTGGACVEVQVTEFGDVLVRNSTDPGGPVIRYTRAEWEAFTGGVLNGEFGYARLASLLPLDAAQAA
jgi:hypothetical protein